jgi:hypothetical protein
MDCRGGRLGQVILGMLWQYVLLFMGLVGCTATTRCLRSVHDPGDHPRMNEAELRYIDAGGALVFLAAHALTAILSYPFIVGEIRHLDLK